MPPEAGCLCSSLLFTVTSGGNRPSSCEHLKAVVPFLCFIATVAVKRVNAASQHLEPDAAGLVRVWALTSP